MCEEDRSHQVESLREELSTLERKHQEEREQADGADNNLRLRLEQLQDELASLAAAKEACEATNQSQKEELEKLKQLVSSSAASFEACMKEKSALERRIEKAKEFFNTKKVEEEVRISELEAAVNSKVLAEKVASDSMAEQQKLKDDTQRLSMRVSELEKELENSSSISEHRRNEFLSDIEKKESTIRTYEAKIDELGGQILRLQEAEEVRQNNEDTAKHAADTTDALARQLEQLEDKDRTIEAMRIAHEEELHQLREKVDMLSRDLDAAQDSLSEKSAVVDTLQQNITAVEVQCSALQSENDHIKLELEKAAAQLESEVQQNLERKKKIRVYVDKLTSDKVQLETQLLEKTQWADKCQKEVEALRAELSDARRSLDSIQSEFANDIAQIKASAMKEVDGYRATLSNRDSEIERYAG